MGSSPRQTVQQMIRGFELTQVVRAAAELCLPDLLAGGPRSVAELAAATEAQPALLRRLLRLLASMGVLAEVEPGMFGLTPAGETLRDEPGSLRAAALAYGALGPRAWGELTNVVRTGRTGFELAFGVRDWEYLAQHPHDDALFNAWMTAGSQAQAEAVVAAYEFPATGTVVDIAGGHGTLLAAVLRARPGLRGVLFDAPHVIAGARSVLEGAGVADRCEVVGGDFFQSVPEGGDLYTMKWILHDWDDARAAAILRTCRRAMGERSTLLVIDRVLPTAITAASTESFDACRADLMMMVWTGGVERTAEEFGTLFETAGFRVARILATATPLSVIEAHTV